MEAISGTTQLDFNNSLFRLAEILFRKSLTPVAGLIFKTKNRAIFLERFFGREITAREQLSRAVILARF
jgi:hypothetical protein